MAESAQPLDLITMGRTGIDLYPSHAGVPLARVDDSRRFSDGAAAGVAATAARLGRSAAVVTRADDLDFFAIRAARVFWFTGTGLSREPDRSATLAALKVRDRTAVTVFGLDWRPALWSDPEAARPCYAEGLRHATIAVGTPEDCAIATGVREPRACAEELLAAGVELAVVGPESGGVLAVHRDGTTAELPAGAGEAFGGRLVHGLLAGWTLEETIRYAADTGGAPDGEDR
ncbi:PfkB family carbohydrate kinase [Streptomyces sp. NPDC000345]|uniref:PfkB family carbohydrate kinase n=1 Tax=Streptomyces sp. NPDC000345 TaxID=3364537 RepID=UPI00369BB2AB